MKQINALSCCFSWHAILGSCARRDLAGHFRSHNFVSVHVFIYVSEAGMTSDRAQVTLMPLFVGLVQY